jgi:hypothetical protein
MSCTAWVLIREFGDLARAGHLIFFYFSFPFSLQQPRGFVVVRLMVAAGCASWVL